MFVNNYSNNKGKDEIVGDFIFFVLVVNFGNSE